MKVGTHLHSPKQNRLLAALSPADYGYLSRHLALVPLPLAWTVYEPGDLKRYVFFPTSAVVSLLHARKDGSCVEVAVVGNEGLVGVGVCLDGTTTPSGAVVQSAGYGYRLLASMLSLAASGSRDLRLLLLRYSQALVTQMAETVLCNRHHAVEEQLCRWLLLSTDRQRSAPVAASQGRISSLLGVRRDSVTRVAERLQAEGLIRCRRGTVTVLDREALESRVCGCYRAVKSESDRLLPRTQIAAEQAVPA